MLQEPTLDTILWFDDKYVARLSEIFADIEYAGLLSDFNVDTAIRRLAQRMEPVKVSDAKIEVLPESEKGEKPVSKLTLDQRHVFFYGQEPTDHFSGEVGSVIKLYPHNDLATATHCMKISHNASHSMVDAEREFHHQTLLGREVFVFTKPEPGTVTQDSACVMSEWISGEPLLFYYTPSSNAEHLRRVPFEQRLKWIICLLDEFNMLHQHDRTHGDPSDGNCILDVTAGTLRLIDFGSSHKHRIEFEERTNAAFDDPENPYSQDISRDVQAAGSLIAMLFPEIYAPEHLSDGGLTSPLSSCQRLAIERLTHAMRHPDLKIRCTIPFAIEIGKRC